MYRFVTFLIFFGPQDNFLFKRSTIKTPKRVKLYFSRFGGIEQGSTVTPCAFIIIDSDGAANPLTHNLLMSVLVSVIVVLLLLFTATVMYFVCVRYKHGLFSRFYRLSTVSLYHSFDILILYRKKKYKYL